MPIVVTIPRTVQQLAQLYMRIAEAKWAGYRALRALELVAASEPDAARPDVGFPEERLEAIYAEAGFTREQRGLLEWADAHRTLLDALDRKFILDGGTSPINRSHADSWSLPGSLFFCAR